MHNQTLLRQLRAKHETALALITLSENAQDATEKKIAADWYDRTIEDINELRVPESEKVQYFDLQPLDNFDILEQPFAAGKRVALTLYDQMPVV